MAQFSNDQVRQYYVIPKEANITINQLGTPLAATAVDGSLNMRMGNGNYGSIWFEYKSPNSGIVRTDLIEKDKVSYIKSSLGVDTPYQRQEIGLDPTINGGAPVIGEKYIFRVRFFGLGVGGNNVQYMRAGGVYTARTGDTAQTIFTAIVDLFNKGIQKEPEQ